MTNRLIGFILFFIFSTLVVTPSSDDPAKGIIIDIEDMKIEQNADVSSYNVSISDALDMVSAVIAPDNQEMKNYRISCFNIIKINEKLYYNIVEYSINPQNKMQTSILDNYYVDVHTGQVYKGFVINENSYMIAVN